MINIIVQTCATVHHQTLIETRVLFVGTCLAYCIPIRAQVKAVSGSLKDLLKVTMAYRFIAKLIPHQYTHKAGPI